MSCVSSTFQMSWGVVWLWVASSRGAPRKVKTRPNLSLSLVQKWKTAEFEGTIWALSLKF